MFFNTNIKFKNDHHPNTNNDVIETKIDSSQSDTYERTLFDDAGKSCWTEAVMINKENITNETIQVKISRQF